MECIAMVTFNAGSSLFMCAVLICIGLMSLAVVFAAIFTSGRISNEESEIERDRSSDPDYNPFNPLDHEQSK